MNITIKGVQPYDGSYDIAATDELTTREWGWIKRLAGYLPLNLTGSDESVFSDPELSCTFAAIALRRAGKIEAAQVPAVFEQLADAPFGSAITMQPDETEDAEGDAGPPDRSSNENSVSSGDASKTSSETLVLPPKVSGIRDSASLASARQTSAT